MSFLLLLDSHRHALSVSMFWAPAPFLCLRFPDVESARVYLARFRDDVWFVRAMQQEMGVAAGAVPVGKPHVSSLIDAASVAAVRGLLQIAVVLADQIDIVFDPARGSEIPEFDSVTFASRSVTDRFLAKQLSDEGNAAAFSAALAHPASARQVGVGAPGTPSAGQAGLVERTVPLLWLRYLVLQPDGPSLLRLRLLWADRNAPVMVIQDAGAAATEPAQPRRPIPSAARAASRLPDAPDSVSPQAQTLVDAAQDGTPFCEECARQAAAMADG